MTPLEQINDTKALHDEYLRLYKSFCERYAKTKYPVIKNYCYIELQLLKTRWVNQLHLDASELTPFEPIKIPIQQHK